MLTCTPDRPWGVHPSVRSDEDCPRCGWTAPGPRGDALADARDEAEAALARAAALGWTVHDGRPGDSLAA